MLGLSGCTLGFVDVVGLLGLIDDVVGSLDVFDSSGVVGGVTALCEFAKTQLFPSLVRKY